MGLIELKFTMIFFQKCLKPLEFSLKLMVENRRWGVFQGFPSTDYMKLKTQIVFIIIIIIVIHIEACDLKILIFVYNHHHSKCGRSASNIHGGRFMGDGNCGILRVAPGHGWIISSGYPAGYISGHQRHLHNFFAL